LNGFARQGQAKAGTRIFRRRMQAHQRVEDTVMILRIDSDSVVRDLQQAEFPNGLRGNVD
jgi:hypothetical protein